MNELRFSCGKCGQHLKAEAGCVDLVIQCPVCQANVRIPSTLETADDGSLPTAWETTSIGTASSAVARATAIRSGATGSRASADASAEAEAVALESSEGGARNRPALLLAAVVVIGIVGVSLWLWKPWQTEVTLAPPSVNGSAENGSESREAAESALQAAAVEFLEAVAQGKPESAEALEQGLPQGMTEEVRGDGADESVQLAPDNAVAASEAGAFAASWTVDFATLPDDARTLVDSQLAPLGLAVSPSIYTATRGRQVSLPARRGTRLELIEEVGRQLGWKPVYDGRQLKFERGARAEPVVFAGPFMLQVAQVTPSTAYATAELTLRLTGVGIPDVLRKAWLAGFKGLGEITARAPDGTDLADPHGNRWGGMPNAGARLLEADCVVDLWHAFRGVTRIASLRAELELPGIPPPHDRLQFEFTDLPLKPGPETPEAERPLVFSGDAPLNVTVHSVIPGEPFDRARVEIQNLADRPLRSVMLDLVYRDAGGGEIRRVRSEHSGDRGLPGVREKRRLDRVMLVGKPEDTTRVDVVVAGAVFAGGVEWKRAE